MKFTFALLAGLACLASASAQAQALATGVSASAARAASSPIGISREKASEVCTTAPRSEWFSEEEVGAVQKFVMRPEVERWNPSANKVDSEAKKSLPCSCFRLTEQSSII